MKHNHLMLLLFVLLLNCNKEQKSNLQLEMTLNSKLNCIIFKMNNLGEDSIFFHLLDVISLCYLPSDTGFVDINSFEYVTIDLERHRNIVQHFNNTALFIDDFVDSMEIIHHIDTSLRMDDISELDISFFNTTLNIPLPDSLKSREMLIQDLYSGLRILRFLPPNSSAFDYIDLQEYQRAGFESIILEYGYHPSGLSFSGIDYEYVFPDKFLGYEYIRDTIPIKRRIIELK